MDLTILDSLLNENSRGEEIIEALTSNDLDKMFKTILILRLKYNDPENRIYLRKYEQFDEFEEMKKLSEKIVKINPKDDYEELVGKYFEKALNELKKKSGYKQSEGKYKDMIRELFFFIYYLQSPKCWKEYITDRLSFEFDFQYRFFKDIKLLTIPDKKQETINNFKFDNEKIKIKENNDNCISIKLYIKKEDIKKEVYFLNNKLDECFLEKNEKDDIINHLKNLGKIINIEIYFDKIKQENLGNYLEPEKEGYYLIILKFKEKIKN